MRCFHRYTATNICDWLAKKGSDKHTSLEVQNEILALMFQAVLLCNCQGTSTSKIFTILTDECVDCANKEQLVICFRYTDENVDVHEEQVVKAE